MFKTKKINATLKEIKIVTPHITSTLSNYFQGLTCIQNLDDGWGLFNVQGDIIKPAVLYQEHEDIHTVVQGTLGLCLKSTGLIWVILGPEPVSRVGVHKKVGRE